MIIRVKPSSSIVARLAFLLLCASDHRNLKDRDQHGRAECRSSTQIHESNVGRRALAVWTSPDEVSVSTQTTLTILVLSDEHDTEKKTEVQWSRLVGQGSGRLGSGTAAFPEPEGAQSKNELSGR